MSDSPQRPESSTTSAPAEQVGSVDATAPGALQPTKPEGSGWSRQNIFFVMVLLAAGMLGASIPYVKDIIFGGKDSAQATANATPTVVVINSDQVSALAMKAMNQGPDAAVLSKNGAAVGEIVGKTIKRAAADYAAKGFIVLDGTSVLAAPAAINVTAPVEIEVQNDLHELALAASQSSPHSPNPSVTATQAPASTGGPATSLP